MTIRPNKVQKPLSELEKDYPQIPVADIDSYVRRAKETRLQEVAQGKPPGKIKRPMNAFMLYRKAYQHLAKTVCTQNNHQVVSQVCGDGWPLEPLEIKNLYNEWAKIERENHQKAHPGYKFTPSKPTKKPRREEPDSDAVSQNGDREWVSQKPMRCLDAPPQTGRAPVDNVANAPMSIFETYHMPHGLGMSARHSLYEYSNPGPPMPGPYNTATFADGHYYQHNAHLAPGGCGIEDVMMAKPSSPMALVHATGFEGQDCNPVMDPYSTVEGGTSHEHYISNQSLIERPNEKSYSGILESWEFTNDSGWSHAGVNIAPLDTHGSMAPLDELLSQDPQLDYLKGTEGSWKVEETGSQTQSDAWQG
ncbi:hypothetical protein jhhlp_006472 [Lomentospora prolificans]|uniref:HMG box domain-containing protein n=1 Tax=Lomentospora prolificans TaxID=41688 RepID=A0A2N3N627_9PEZI|nr:hypothetical protein jhhlp_006472 [Lomentospora prolificans]